MRVVTRAHLRIVDDPRLGVISDRELANHYRCARESVAAARRAKSIATAHGPKGIAWDEVDDLGLVRDSEIATRFGCSAEAVAKARRARSIPAFRDRTVAS